MEILPALFQKEKIGRMFPDVVFGVCSTKDPLLENCRDNMEKILPGAAYLVVIAAAHSPAALNSGNIQVKQYDTLYTYQRAGDLSHLLCREIAAAGHAAVAVPAFLPIDMLGEGKGMRGEICWRRAGVAAGLGRIGKSGLLVTKAFGPAVRLGGLLTTYPCKDLISKKEGEDQNGDANSCENCAVCLESCPAGALGEFKIDKKKCGDYIFAYGLRRFSRFLEELFAADEQKRREILRSPALRELWQNFMTGCYYYCWECQASCPGGKRRGQTGQGT